MGIEMISIQDIISVEFILPLLGALFILTIYIFNKRLRILIVTSIILHLIIAIYKIISFIYDIKYLESFLSEVHQSELFDLVIKTNYIQAINLFAYMLFVLVTVLFIGLRCLKERSN